MRRLTSLFVSRLIGSSIHMASAGTGTVRAKRHHTASARHPQLSLDSARVTAQANVPTGTVKAHKLGREHGHLIYSFEFVVTGQSGI